MTQRIRTLFTRSFWADAGERALKSAGQWALGAWGIGDQMFHKLDADPATVIGAAAAGALVSILTSVASAPVGGPTASLLGDRVEG